MADNEKNKPANASGPNAWDDALKPVIEHFLEHTLDKLFDTRYVDGIIRSLPPAAKKSAKAAPSFVAYLLAKVPDKAFLGNPEIADFVRDVAVEAVRHAADLVEKKGELTADDMAGVIKTARQEVEQRRYAIDPLGHYHMIECPSLALLRQLMAKPAQQPRDKNSPAPQPTQFQFAELSFKDILLQKRQPSPCCRKGIEAEQAEAEKKATPAAKPLKFSSPADLLGYLTKEQPEMAKKVKLWFNTLTQDEIMQAVEGFGELNHINELAGIMFFRREHRLAALKLMRDRDASHVVQGIFAKINEALKAGGTRVLDSLGDVVEAAKKLDVETFGPMATAQVERWNKRRQTPREERKPEPKPPVPWSLKKMFGGLF